MPLNATSSLGLTGDGRRMTGLKTEKNLKRGGVQMPPYCCCNNSNDRGLAAGPREAGWGLSLYGRHPTQCEELGNPTGVGDCLVG